MPDARKLAALPATLFGLSLVLFALMLFKHASYPLLWQDEAATAMLGTRVLEHGYPKVHDERAAIYPSGLPVEEGISLDTDAFRAGLWGPYYVGAAADWVARGAADPWSRTGRLRGVFSLLGCAGIALFCAVMWPLLAPGPTRWAAGAVFLLLLTGSVSFVLHLREVGPLAPTVFLLAAALYAVLSVQRARIAGGATPLAKTYLLALVPLLFLLGVTSTLTVLAFFVTALLYGVVRAARRGKGALSHDLLPLLLAAVALYPVISFYGPEGLRWDLLGLARGGKASFAASLGDYLLHLMRYEWLLPVLLARVAMLVLRRLPGRAPERQAERLAAADLLMLFVGVYLLVLAGLPVFLERHAVVLSPVLAALLVLDGCSLHAWCKAREGGSRRAGLACAGVVAIAWLAVAALHLPEIAGRVHEITHRYRGPLDHLVSYIRDHYDDPSELVIATNYEAAALRYYLDASVIVGAFPTRIEQDYEARPDLILPRPSGRSQGHLGKLAARADYDQEDLPVLNLRSNNVPTLSSRDAMGQVHRFESADLPKGSAGVPVLERPR